MNNTSFSQRSPEVGPRAGLTRLIRRVCVLQEQGDAAGAARLRETELASAVRDLRLAHGPETLPDDALQALFAAEEKRVAEAGILAELLAPRLRASLPTVPAPVLVGGPRALPPSPAPGRTLAGSPAIPDLLDAMLAAERHGRRPPATFQPES